MAEDCKDKAEKFSIGTVATLCHISVKTLRYYDKIDLLKPQYRKETSNYRYYSKEQLTTVYMIRRLRSLGFPLKDIQAILNARTLDGMLERVGSQLKAIEAEIADLQMRHREIALFEQRIQTGCDYLREHREHQEAQPSFQLMTLPEIYLFSKQKMIASDRNEEVNLENWIQIVEDAKRAAVSPAGSVFVTFHSEIFGQFLQNDCDVEYSIRVSPEDRDAPGVRVFGGIEAATTLHFGDYHDIIHTYIGLKRWIEAQGYHVSGYATEEFIVSPIDVGRSEDHVTRIMIPVSR